MSTTLRGELETNSGSGPATSPRMSRRELLARAGGLGAGAWAAAGVPEALAAQMMPTRVLGKTGMRVSILGFGGTVDVVPPLLNLALQSGVTYIDTADSYNNGNSEGQIGSILAAAGKRRGVHIVTKCAERDPAQMDRRLNTSLERLRTDYTDIWMMHWIDEPALLENREIRAAAERWKKQRKMRFFGFSHHGSTVTQCLELAAKVGWIDVVMIKFNFRDYGEAALNRALDACAKAKIGLVAMKTQAGAVTTGRTGEFEQKGLNRWQAALKAVWADQRIATIVSRMSTIQQVQENVAATRQKLTMKEWRLLRQYARETNHLYCRGCGQHCRPASGSGLDIPELFRCLMYHDNYGEPGWARAVYASLGDAQRSLVGADLSAAERACPYGLPVARLLREAERKLA